MTKYLFVILLVLLGLALVGEHFHFLAEEPLSALSSSGEGNHKQTEHSNLNGESHDEVLSRYPSYFIGNNGLCVLLVSSHNHHLAQGFVNKPFTPPNVF